jgi:hypothetical protein
MCVIAPDLLGASGCSATNHTPAEEHLDLQRCLGMRPLRTALLTAALLALAAAPAGAQTFAFGAPTALPGVGFYAARRVSS